jgi:uncharacterized membrane protein
MDIREQLARDLLNCPYGELTAQKKSVIDLIADQRPTGLGPQLKEKGTFWDGLADGVARVGGSWKFIFGFCIVLALWIGSNVVLAAFREAFDPYPFIFLNLMLSMVAALQAPVIMMSQNRQAAIDRKAAEHDYVVNLRAELEIMLLHDKLDALREGDLLQRLDGLAAQISALRAEVSAQRGGAPAA